MLKIFANFINPDKDPLFDCIRDNFSDKPITLFYDIFPKNQSELALNPYNFLFIHEPNEFFGLHNRAIKDQSLFTGIFSWNGLVLNSCSNPILSKRDS